MKMLILLFFFLFPIVLSGQDYNWNNELIISHNIKKVYISEIPHANDGEINYKDVLIEYEFDKKGNLIKKTVNGDNFYPTRVKYSDLFTYDSCNNLLQIIEYSKLYHGVEIDTVHYIYHDKFIIDYKVKGIDSNIESIHITLLNNKEPFKSIEIHNLGEGYYNYIDYNYFILPDSGKFLNKTSIPCKLESFDKINQIEVNSLIRTFNYLSNLELQFRTTNFKKEYFLFDKESNLVSKYFQEGVKRPKYETIYNFNRLGLVKEEEEYIINSEGIRKFNLRYFYSYEFWQ